MPDARWGDPREYADRDRDDERPRVYDERDWDDQLKAAGTICRFVFHRDGEPIRHFRAAWRNACKAAGCPGALVHDMRRSAVRTFERAGVPRSIAMEMIGHKTESIYRRYAIVDQASRRDAAARLDGWIETPKPAASTGTVTAFRTGTGSERDQSGVSRGCSRRRAIVKS
jgi:hypothetical protein